MYTAISYFYPQFHVHEKIATKNWGGKGVWDPIFSIVKIANLPELLTWSLNTFCNKGSFPYYTCMSWQNYQISVLLRYCCIWPFCIFPSRVSGRGYKIGPVCACVCVCVFVCQRSHGWTIWPTDLKFSMDITFDNISDEFEGQRSRSPFWKTWFSNFSMVWRHSMTSWHHLRTFGQGYWQRGHIAGGRVNAQVFSLSINIVHVSRIIPASLLHCILDVPGYIFPMLKIMYTVNRLRLQANVASALLTFTTPV